MGADAGALCALFLIDAYLLMHGSFRSSWILVHTCLVATHIFKGSL